ncbi:MAG: type II toxin-antitoxin system HigB family toxin, partial [Flavobacteriales bacterium]|nr:type II toxin-antitoxin system HigB family toxin [Flavobacteriales bacterium]
VWYSEAKKAEWTSPHDVKKQFRSSSLDLLEHMMNMII